MQHHKITGIILKLDPFHEFDKSIIVFSYEFGLMRLLAKGVRRIKSARSYHLDLFNYVEIEIEESGVLEATRRYVREVSTLETFSKLKRSLEHFSIACVVASFILRTVPMGSLVQAELYELTMHTFFVLNTPFCDPSSVLYTYTLKAAKLLGHLPTRIAKSKIRGILQQELDPQFTLQARRTLGSFSKLERTRSS